MDLELSIMQSRLAKIIGMEDRMHIRNTRNWKGWSEIIDDMMSKLGKLSVELREKLKDPVRHKDYQENVWRDISSVIEAVTPKPATGRSWNDMSRALLKKCIEKMDLKTRCALRKTSRREKQLVDGTKLSLRSVTCTIDQHLKVRCSDGKCVVTFSSETLPLETVLLSLDYLLVAAAKLDSLVFEEPEFYENGRSLKSEVLNVLIHSAPLRCKNVECLLQHDDGRIPLFVLNNCEVRISAMAIRVRRGVFPLLYNCPGLYNVNFILWDSEDVNLFILYVTQKWIDDEPVGERKVSYTSKASVIEPFMATFERRFISRTRYKHRDTEYYYKGVDVVRIRTNDPEMHVCLCAYHEIDRLGDHTFDERCKWMPASASDFHGDSDAFGRYVALEFDPENDAED